MRTFHTGGVAGDDITQGLPRVEELFEARKPKKMATLAEITGTISIEEGKRGTIRAVSIIADDGDVRTYHIPYSIRLKAGQGDLIHKGDELTEGVLNPHDILAVRGVSAVQEYLTQEVQRVYRQQGVDINDKHIEVIVRQMMRKIRIEDGGDTELLAGAAVDVFRFEDENERIAKLTAEDGIERQPATGTTILMGITKASLATDSFLSAASFQETTKVLTEAAIKGKVDKLQGLKENVIIGKLIPAGSGLEVYRDYDELNAPESSVTAEMIENEEMEA